MRRLSRPHQCGQLVQQADARCEDQRGTRGECTEGISLARVEREGRRQQNTAPRANALRRRFRPCIPSSLPMLAQHSLGLPGAARRELNVAEVLGRGPRQQARPLDRGRSQQRPHGSDPAADRAERLQKLSQVLGSCSICPYVTCKQEPRRCTFNHVADPTGRIAQVSGHEVEASGHNSKLCHHPDRRPPNWCCGVWEGEAVLTVRSVL